ncbi:MAG: chromosomal replication initiator protein DnaA [Actinomycetota bacterium]|nr:chromosomal replication initiator protein DnaA [Actinomycetota bacterium]
MSTARRLWTSCTQQLRSQVTDGTWQPWFAGIQPLDLDSDVLYLGVPSAVVRTRLEERYLPLIESAASDAAGRPVRVELRVDATPEGDRQPTHQTNSDDSSVGRISMPGRGTGDDLAEPSAPDARPVPPGPHPPSADPPTTSDRAHPSPSAGPLGPREPPRGAAEMPSLNPRYVFDAFVIGASNRFAHAAAQRVAEMPAASYNPLFIYGDSGLGKTHLLHAIGHYVIENFNGRRVRYVSTETFLNDFIEAIRNSSQASFKRRYRDCDVLLVDDIQFMENKEGLQEEFFHTFNTLYEGSRQIVLSSDRPPRSIATLEDRLRSRFEWGLITDVQPPELETRLAILRKKAEGERTPVPDEVLELIATNVRDNIRELEGALTRVAAFASLNRETLTRETAERVLADILDAGRPRQLTPSMILLAVSEEFGFSVEDLIGPKRQRPLVRARQIGMYLCRDLTEYSYPAIGREFGGRDHTTVIHAVEKITSFMKEDRQTYDQVTGLLASLRGS